MSLLMLLCQLGMAAMGGVTWVLTRLPGKRTERNGRMGRHSNCLPVGTKRAAEAEQSTPNTNAENGVAERV